MNTMRFFIVAALTVSSAILHYLLPSDIKDNFVNDIPYDYIIVGGGTAGCVLANRLSADTSKRVLIIEAGEYPRGWTRLVSTVPIAVPFLLGSSLDWQYWTTSQESAMKAMKQRRISLPAGRVFGGTSVINAMIYATGQDRDLNEYEGWTDNREYYERSICKNSTSQNCLHISQSDGLQKLTEAFLEIGELQGQEIGFVKPNVSVEHGIRRTVFDAFITPILSRRNLYRLTKTEVQHVLLENQDGKPITTGVIVNSGRRHYVIKIREGGEVIISAGAIATPKILLASGIGPKFVLAQLKINQSRELPVGENVQDHPFVGIYFSINQTVSLTKKTLTAPNSLVNYILHGKGALAHASGLTGIGYISLQKPDKPEILPYSSTKPRDIEFLSFGVGSIINELLKKISNFDDESWKIYKPPNYHETEEGFLINIVLMRPKSRGRLLVSDLSEKPSVDTRHLTHPKDMNDLVTGVLYALELIESSAAYRSMGAKAYLPVYKECENLKPRSREAIECLVTYVSAGMYHITSSCSMGNDPSRSVVDFETRVHGIKALRVVDASTLPNVPSGHPMAVVIMMSERVAQLISKDDNVELKN